MKAKVDLAYMNTSTSLSSGAFMTSISTDGHAGSQPQPSFLRRGSDKAFTLTFLTTSTVATVGWLYILLQGALAVTNWLFG